MSTYLLTWKPDKLGREKLEERLERYSLGETSQQWSCGLTKNIPVGSRVFLTKQGEGYKGVFGSGYVQQEPFEQPHFNEEKRKAGKTTMCVIVNFDRLYDPQRSIKINRAELNEFDTKIWDSQGSGKKIPEEAAIKLESLWVERTGSVSTVYPDEVVEKSGLYEGATKSIVVNAYERNLEARARCISKWGLNCAVCNFNFESFYGQVGTGYIHVHHLKPLAEIREEYEVNPVEDLRPVCPNCHSMLHQKQPPFSIEELKKLVSIN